MGEPDRVGTLIERIVAGARIPSRAKRDDLRRELWAHFEDAGDSPETIQQALSRFGTESTVTHLLRRVYRLDFVLLNLARIVVSIFASVAAALVIQLLVDLRVEVQANVWRLVPGCPPAEAVPIAVVLGLVTAWEAVRPPFRRGRAALSVGAYALVCLLVRLVFASGLRAFATATILVVLGYLCSRLEPRPARLLLIFGAFTMTLYADHLASRVAFGPSRAMVASAVLVAAWSSTILILGRVDRAFVGWFQPGTE